LTCIGFAVLVGMAGTDQIQERLATLGLGSPAGSERPEARLELWQALLRAVRDFPVLGTGFGSHEYVYPLYLEKVYPVRFTHAENSYLQLLVEGGVLTALLVALALGWLGSWCVVALRGTKRPDVKPCMVAIAAGLAAGAVHGTVDFVWYIPSHALLLAVLAGLAFALARMQKPGRIVKFPFASRSRVAAAGLASALLFIPWLQTSYAHARASLHWTEFQTAADSHDPDNPNAELGAVDATPLKTAVRERPDQPMYHAALAECLRQEFLRSPQWQAAPMPLLQLRAAVQESRFDTPEKRDQWLDSLYGCDNRLMLALAREHYREVVRLCPLNGRAYLRLAELNFMAPPDEASPTTLLQQAVKVRPHDPDLCYEAGLDFINQADMLNAMECWRLSALASEKHKQAILAQLVQAVPLPQLVKHFQPDYESLLSLVRERFTGKGQRNNRLYLLGKAKELTRQELNPEVVGPRMRRLHEAFLLENAREEAGQCIRVAAAAEPHLVSTRLLLARWLFGQRLFKEAREELDWCNLRDPGNAELRQLRAAVFEQTAYHAPGTAARNGVGPPNLLPGPSRER